MRGGGSRVSGREGGRMGRGVSIQTQTITKPSKAARGRLGGSVFSEVFGSRARAGEQKEQRRGDWAWLGGRAGWSPCDSARDLLGGWGGLTTGCGLGLGPRGLCIGGADLQAVSHGGVTERGGVEEGVTGMGVSRARSPARGGQSAREGS